MIVLSQGMQRNGTLYETVHSNNTAYTYSSHTYAPHRSSTERHSFAYAINEVRDKSRSDTPAKSQTKNDKKSIYKSAVNTEKNTEKMSQLSKRSPNNKKVKEHSAKDENIRKISAKENSNDDDEKLLNHINHIQLQELPISKKNTAKVRYAETHEEREFKGKFEQISLHMKNVEKENNAAIEADGEVEAMQARKEKDFGMFEKQSENILSAADDLPGQEYQNDTTVSMQKMHPRIDDESEKFLKNIHRDQGASMTTMHTEAEINAKKEENLSRVTHDEDGEKSFNEQLRFKPESEKHTHAKVSLEMMTHDDGKEKSQFFGTTSETSLDAIHQKKNYLHSANSSVLEKKGLRYLSQHGNQQLVQDVKLLFRENSTGDIRLQLNPKELGEVKLTVQLNDNNLVHARAIVSSEDAKDLMQKNLGNLARHFNSEGYEIGTFSVLVNTEHSDTNEGMEQFPKRHVQRKEHVRAREIEQNMRSYVRVCQSIDFVA